jgi:chromosomal replication initiator protein
MNVWDKALGILKDSLSVPTYETWFKPVELATETEETVILKVPSEFAKEWLETKYLSLIESALSEARKKPTKAEFVIGEKKKIQPAPKITVGDVTLNKNYTFENFVVGNSNRLAYAASIAIAKNPGKTYNPLYIYGGVGLGKTHLLQAIAHYIVKNFPDLKIIYTTTEKFTNEVIYAIQNAQSNRRLIDQFHRQYRTVDVLLIDDVQFLAGKERTQEEFFHTFNTLHDAGKQIVLTSDCPPKEIATLQERLTTRFEWGLVSDIQPPDFETRVAILKKKADIEGIKVSDEVLFYIAKHIYSNIRELEGALVRLVATASLANEEITFDFTKRTLSDIIHPARDPITIKRIKKVVAEYFNIPEKSLSEKRRSQNIAMPRQIAMFLSRELTDASLPQIGKEFGGRDHTTVMHACAKIKKELKKQETMQALVDEIKKRLNGVN